MISINKLEDLWAKSSTTKESKGESLLAHSLNVINVIEKICGSLPLDIAKKHEIAKEAVLCAALHDSGKVALGFQLSLRTGNYWNRRHEMLSLAIASMIIKDLSVVGLFAIATHHKSIEYFDDVFNGQQIPSSESKIWQEMVNNIMIHKSLLIEYVNIILSNAKFTMDDFDALCSETRLKKAWFSKKYQPYKVDISQRYRASLLRGLLITADHIASAHQFDLPKVPVLKDYVSIVNKQELKNQNILPFQERCARITGDAILKAPTGSGKTAAILLWAANNQVENGRLFYVLPHTASINAMHKRLQKIYCEKNVGVLHHKNAEYLFKTFENDNSSYNAAQMAKSLSELARELYHPIRVTTPHQILRVALQGKGWELGLAEFPNACFVFDEIHAFEPLLTGLTIATVKWLKSMGAKVLFASATLPLFLEEILKEEIGITNIISPDSRIQDDKEVLNKTRHKIEIREGSLYSNIDDIIKEIKNSGIKTTLVICNHVDTSRKIYEKFKKCFDINEIKLFHSRFNAADRFNIETTIQSKNPPKILIATQAIEVSLDLDYDCGYIEPAPADALGQRLGRINRKGSRPNPAKVIIFEEPSLKSKGKPFYLPYDEEITKKTINFLRKNNLLSEQQLTDIVNEIYKDGYIGSSKEDYGRGLNNPAIEKFNEDMIAGTYKPWVEEVIEGTDGLLEILPSELCNDFRQLKEEKKYLEAKMLLVPIQLRQSKRLFREKVLYWDKGLYEYVANLDYSSDSGLDISKQIENIY
ncbi:MAG: CRISPR-associated helicase Cas3' [Deltaproteobacteria bacterium]|jgi:CRISPR-associated endonuclease/helicase Cas3|nr:CRISPR-associated helicase Cas3' [Deltaproteobacteria bacterium]MCL5879304.1 CRISPR-associated helicase Cas3' [Deltaproteobacteria bacterium]MDA8305070.1 CRISPR-associated helicase Cas3' [Deltaproteobacteria bacterium]